jgi:hypothetical protein
LLNLPRLHSRLQTVEKPGREGAKASPFKRNYHVERWLLRGEDGNHGQVVPIARETARPCTGEGRDGSKAMIAEDASLTRTTPFNFGLNFGRTR